MRLIGVVRPTEWREVVVEADGYERAREQLEAQVPEGWELILVRTDRSAGQG